MLIGIESHSLNVRSRKHSFSRGNTSSPSLYPLYLPFNTQHRLLAKVQAILEDACYSFGLRMMESVVQNEGWDCPESVELNIWTKVFRHNENKFDANGIRGLGKPFPDFLDSIAQIRHSAVHRVRVTANTVEKLLADAGSLAELLGNLACARTLLRLQRETKLAVGELGRNKDLLESRLTEKLREIADARAALDRIEQTAVEDMLNEDKEYQNFAGMNLEQAINAPETVLHSPVASEQETISEADEDLDSLDEHSIGQIEDAASASTSTNMV